MGDLNERQMEKTQEYLHRMTSLIENEPAVDAQYDVSYSNRSQDDSKKAEQSFAAIIEHTSTRKLPIAAALANKHGRIRGCDHTQGKCKKTYRSDKSIAASERSLLHGMLKSVEMKEFVTLRSITTDTSTQVTKAARDYNSHSSSRISHYKSFVHKLRTLQRHVRALSLSSIPKAYNKQGYIQKLASCIRTRIRMELRNARALKKYDQQFIASGTAAVFNITNCLSGDHQQCRQKSFVCNSRLSTYSTSMLPYGVHLQLCQKDLHKNSQFYRQLKLKDPLQEI